MVSKGNIHDTKVRGTQGVSPKALVNRLGVESYLTRKGGARDNENRSRIILLPGS